MSFDVKIERIPRDMSDKKTASPTISMVRHILLNVNQSRGLWFLKAPHRTRKKGSERFRAIRLVDMGATQGIRIRCKPGGNDTCYEYTLMPPADVNPEVLMELLTAVHPSTLRMPVGSLSSVAEEVAIFKALVDRAIDAPPSKERNASDKVNSEEWNEDAAHELENLVVNSRANALKEAKKPVEEATTGKLLEMAVYGEQVASLANARLVKLESEGKLTPKQVEEAELARRLEGEGNVMTKEVGALEAANDVRPSGKISTLDIVPDEDDEDGKSILLSYQFVLDRALIAISFVSEGGYAKRIVISDSIVKNLNIGGFIEVSTVYKVIESGMRALMMGLCNEGFVKRVFHGGRSTSKDTLQGYRLTPKGEKRILALREFLQPELMAKMSPDWQTSENYEGSDAVVDDEADYDVEFAVPVDEVLPKSEFTTDQILRLEAWLTELKEHNERILEIEALMGDLRTEKEDDLHHLLGLEVARDKALKQREELDRELARFDAKKSELEGMAAKKDGELADWNEELKTHTSKKARLEGEIGSAAGMRRT